MLRCLVLSCMSHSIPRLKLHVFLAVCSSHSLAIVHVAWVASRAKVLDPYTRHVAASSSPKHHARDRQPFECSSGAPSTENRMRDDENRCVANAHANLQGRGEPFPSIGSPVYQPATFRRKCERASCFAHRYLRYYDERLSYPGWFVPPRKYAALISRRQT